MQAKQAWRRLSHHRCFAVKSSPIYQVSDFQCRLQGSQPVLAVNERRLPAANGSYKRPDFRA
jgi:hypothetical protein